MAIYGMCLEYQFFRGVMGEPSWQSADFERVVRDLSEVLRSRSRIDEDDFAFYDFLGADLSGR